MLKEFTEIALFITREQSIILLFMVGYIFSEKKIFTDALTLLLFTMVYNHWLKSIFRVPLPVGVDHEGWAFPSGHMHTSFVFLAYIGYKLRYSAPIFLSILTLIVAVGFSLVYKGFHYLFDIIGAILFGSITIIFTQIITIKIREKSILNNLVLYLLPLSLIIHFFLIKDPFKYQHLFIANCSLAGIFISIFIDKIYFEGMNYKSDVFLKKIATLLFSLIGIFLIKVITQKINASSIFFSDFKLAYLPMSMWMILGPLFCYRIIRSIGLE